MIKKKLARVAAENLRGGERGLPYPPPTSRMPGAAQQARTEAFKAIEEYTVEASLAKVHGSEVLALAVDEGVQIFGGYGFMHEYPIEKSLSRRPHSAYLRGYERNQPPWSPPARFSNARSRAKYR